MKNSTKIILGIIVLVGGVFLFSLINNSDPNQVRIGPLGSTHEHAAFQIYLDSKLIEFARPEYMVTAKEVHIEGMDGEVIHKHATGVTMGYFLDTLGYSFDNDCLITDTGINYCDDSGENLKFYVNGEPNAQFGNYNFRNQDRMLITYGSQDREIAEQLNSLNEVRIK